MILNTYISKQKKKVLGIQINKLKKNNEHM